MNVRRRVAIEVAACLALFIPRVVHAQGPQVAEDAEVARLGAFIHMSAEDARDSRHMVVASGVIGGAVMIPTGLVLWHRTDAVSQSIGAGMTIGGAAPLAFAALSLSHSPMERFDREFEARRALGMPAASLIHDAEAEWSDLASEAHDRRIIRGVVMIVLGAAASGAGTFLLLNDPVWGVSRNDQYTVGSSLIGPGVPFLTLGLRALVLPSIEESSWKAYSTATRMPAPIPQFSVMPVQGGALASLSLSL